MTFRGLLLLGLLLISQGFAQLALKIFERHCPAGEVTPFVMVLFLSATLLTGIWMAVAKSKVRTGDASFGALIGVPNLLTGSFLTLALQEVNGAIVYSVSNVATLFLLEVGF